MTLTPWRGDPRPAEVEQLQLARAVRVAISQLRVREVDEETAELRRLIEEADAENEVRAARRAKSQIRRICRQYGLCRMWTLTYAGEGCHDRAQLVAHLEAFARAIKSRLPEVVWLAVPELHPDGHGWHVHLAVSEFIHWGVFNQMWPHGMTESPRGPDGKKLAGRIDASVTASYLGKYVAKSLGEGRTHLGQHRYFRPKGLEVTVEDLGAGLAVIAAYDDARAVAVAYFGGPPVFEWTSDGVEDWQGPPAAWLDFWPRAERKWGRHGPSSA